MVENLANVFDYPKDQTVILPFDSPQNQPATWWFVMAILHPKDRLQKLGKKAWCSWFGHNSEEDALGAILDGTIQKGMSLLFDTGPKGGPGMREMLSPTSAWPAKQKKRGSTYRWSIFWGTHGRLLSPQSKRWWYCNYCDRHGFDQWIHRGNLHIIKQLLTTNAIDATQTKYIRGLAKYAALVSSIWRGYNRWYLSIN